MASGVPLFHIGENFNLLVPHGHMPISTHIMRKLGAVPVNNIPGLGRVVNWGSVVRR
jgi:hypothetical protein